MDKRYSSPAIPEFKVSRTGTNFASRTKWSKKRFRIAENAMHSQFAVREWKRNEKQGFSILDETEKEMRKRNALNGRRYKDLFKTKKGNGAGHALGEKNEELVKRDGSVIEATFSEKVQVETIAGKSASSFGQQGIVSHQLEEVCLSDAVVNIDISGGIRAHNEDTQDLLSAEHLSDQDHIHFCDNEQDIGMENQHKQCTQCGHDGKLLSCVGHGCGRSFHLCCVDPPFTYFPSGVWHCMWCVKKKMELGVYSVSEGIESVLDAEGVSDDEAMQKQYLVKYKGLAHVHNCWISKGKLLRKAPAVLSRYKRQNCVTRWKKKWSEPQRLLEKRLLLLPKQPNSNYHEGEHCRYAWLVKWTGLGYNQATWELEDAPFFGTPEGMKLINDFATRHKVQEEATCAEEDKRRKISCYELSELPYGCQEYLISVNKLRERWHRDQNALIVDAQERIVMVVLFLLSMLKERSRPCLIITTSTSLPFWEAEFLRWASVINFVVYEGDGDTRYMIRTLEFYNAGGFIMFQVLLSPSFAAVEDLENLKPIKWEVIIVDDFQRSTIAVHSEQIKMLTANMRLLLISGQIKDWSLNCRNALSLLDPNYERADDDVLWDDGGIDISEQKGKLVDFIVYERKREAVKLVEFWVPVMLTDIQTEQYCASLFSNSVLLCSSKSDSACTLFDVLKTTRKSCDHPYLVDRSSRNLVLQGKPARDHFDVEIQMSGKLQLLNKILQEIKRRGLRVVILFQAIDCYGNFSIGDILDDFILQKFGANSYSRIDGAINRSKKRAAVDVFNNKDNGKFVCIIEIRDCLPSTKLSSVDTIFIFNSDWDPLNNLKALQKICIESQFEQLKIFRFYSPYTVEEKVLILAKEGVPLDSNIMNMKQSTCQKLLTWGASCLFRKLDNSHELNEPLTNPVNSLEQTLLEDVFQELSALLPCNGVEIDSTCCSSIKNNSKYVLSVQLSEGTYHGNNVYLVGELKAQSEEILLVDRELKDESPRIFWRRLLEGRKPRWKYISSPSQRIKRNVRCVSSFSYETTDETKATKKSRTGAISFLMQRPKRQIEVKRRLHGEGNKRKLLVNSPNSGLKRYKQLCKVARKVSVECGIEAVASYRHHVGEAQEASGLCYVGGQTDDVLLGVEPHNSPVESCSLPSELPASTSSLSVGQDGGILSEAREGQNGHSNLVGASCCLEASIRTPEGSSWPISNADQQSISNLPLQPATTLFERSEPDSSNLERENINPDLWATHSSEARLMVSRCLASLQREIERIEEARGQDLKLLKDLKLHLASECETEIREVRKKYDYLIHHAEVVMAEKESVHESCYQIAYKQKLLAEAMMLKQDGVPAGDSPGNKEVTQSTFMRDIYQSCFGQPSIPTISRSSTPGNTRPVTGSDLSTVEQCAAWNCTIPEEDAMEPHTTIGSPATSEVMNTVPAVLRTDLSSSDMPMCMPLPQTSVGQVMRQSSSAGLQSRSSGPEHSSLSSNAWRPPVIPTIRLSGNVPPGRETRAPAPHLRHTLPS